MKTKLLVLFVSLAFVLPLSADELELPPELERFEQMLVRSPSKGEAFDRLYRHFLDREQLDGLAGRWSREAGARPEHADRYLLLLGYLAERRGALQEARDRYEEALERDESASQAWIALGELHIGQGALGEGIDALKQALETPLSPADRQEVTLDLGRAQLRTFDLDGARETWGRLVEEHPDDPFILEEVGEALLQAGEFEGARETLQRLADSSGADPFRRLQASLWVAEAFEREGDFDAARKGYDEVLDQTQPGSWLQRQALGRIESLFSAHGQTEELVAFYESRLEERRDLFIARRLRQTLARLNRHEEANTWLQRMAEWAPTDGPLQADLARWHMENREWEEAEDILLRLTRNDPEEWSYREALGELYLARAESGEPDYTEKARETWAGLAPADSRDPARIARLGDLYRRHEWNDLALEAYERALALVPEDYSLREKTALYLFDLDREDEGWALLRGGGEPLPSADNYHRLARFERRHDRTEAALASLERAIELDPDRFALHELHWEILAERERWDECLERIGNLHNLLPNDFHQPRVDRRHLRALRETGRLEPVRESLEAAFAEAQEAESPMDEEDLRFLLFLQIADNREEAIATTTARAAEWYPDSFAITRLRLEHARAQNDLEGQDAALRDMMVQRPNRKGEWLRELVNAYRAHYQMPDAKRYAEELVELNPADSDAQLLLAEIQYNSGESLEANKVLRQAILIAHDPAPLRSRLSEALSQRGEYEEALELLETNFQETASRDSRLALVRQMSDVYLRHGTPDELLQRLSERNPELRQTADYHFFRGEILLEAGDYVRAREELERAAALEPDNLDIPRSLIRLASDEGNFEEAVRYARQLFTVESVVENEMTLAKLLLRAGEIDESLEIISRHGTYFVEQEDEWSEFFEHIGEATVRERFIQVIRNQLRTAESPWRAELALAEFFIRRASFDEADDLLWSVYLSEPEPVEDWEEDADEAAGTAWMGQQLHPAQEQIQQVYYARHQFSQLLATDHPFFSHPNHSQYTQQYWQQSGGQRDQEAIRSDALGYLAMLAILRNQERAFLEKWNDAVQAHDLSSEDYLIEKLKLEVFDDSFVSTLNDTMDHGQNPELESLIFQNLHSNETGAPVSDHTDAGEALSEAYQRLRERVYEDNTEFLAWERFRDLYETLAVGQSLDSPESTYAEIEELLEIEDAQPFFYHWVTGTYLQTALHFEDYGKARELLPRVLEDSMYDSGEYASSLHSEIIETAVLNNRPLDEDGFALLDAVLEESIDQPVRAQMYYGYTTYDTIETFPILFSDHVDQRLLEAYSRMYTVHARHGEEEALKTFLQRDDAGGNTRQARQWIRTLTFFIHLWADDHEQAVALAEEILASGRDNGVQLNLALIHEQRDDYPTTLRLLDSLQLNHHDLYSVIQWKIVRIASRDEEQYPIGQMAVRRLARNWDNYRYQIREELEELYQMVGLDDEWERREETARATRRQPDPAWRTLHTELEESGDEEEGVALARRLLASAPLGYQETSARQARYLIPSYRHGVHGLRTAKEEALSVLDRNGELDPYLKELEAAHQTNPTSIQLLARLIEATEFSPDARGDAGGESGVSRDPSAYYDQVLSLRPNHPYFFHAYAQYLNANESFDRLVELYQGIAESNPLIVLRGDDEIARDAYIRAGRMPELVDRLLEAPLLQFDLAAANGQVPVLARNLESAAETLETHGYHEESLRVRSRALELLPLEETQETRLNLIVSLREAGTTEPVNDLVRGFFFSSERDETPLLFSLSRARSDDLPSWMKAGEVVFSNSSYGELPYPAQILRAAPVDSLKSLFEEWSAGMRENGAPDLANRLYGALLHYALRDASFPLELARFMELAQESDGTATEFISVFRQTFKPVLFQALPAFEPDEGLLEELFHHHRSLTNNQRYSLYYFGSDTQAKWRQFDAALALRQHDPAWETGREILDLLSLEGEMPSSFHPAFARLLRLASSRLSEDAFLALCEDLLENTSLLRYQDQLKNTILWEKERVLLRRGEVRKPYVANYPGTYRSRDEIEYYWEISSISPDDSIHEQDRTNFAWFYGEPFEALDGRFDVEFNLFESNDEPSPITSKRILEADAAGSAVIPLPVEMDEVFVQTTVYEAGTEEVTAESRKLFLLNAPNAIEEIPLLTESSNGNRLDLSGWEVLGNYHHAGPQPPFDFPRSVTFPGPGNADDEFMMSDFMSLEGIDALSLHSMIRHSSTSPNAFEIIFYDDEGEELQRQQMNLTSNPERWILYSSHYRRAESPQRPGRTMQFAEDAAAMRILIQSRAPLTVGDLRVHLLP